MSGEKKISSARSNKKQALSDSLEHDILRRHYQGQSNFNTLVNENNSANISPSKT